MANYSACKLLFRVVERAPSACNLIEIVKQIQLKWSKMLETLRTAGYQRIGLTKIQVFNQTSEINRNFLLSSLIKDLPMFAQNFNWSDLLEETGTTQTPRKVITESSADKVTQSIRERTYRIRLSYINDSFLAWTFIITVSSAIKYLLS